MPTTQGEHRSPHDRALRRHRERGTGTLEYVAAWAMAAMLAIGAIGTLEQGKFEVIAQQAICRVKTAISGGACTPSGSGNPKGQPPFDPKPTQCTVSTDTQKLSTVIKVAFLKFGQDAGFLETVYSDGSVSLTATDGGSLGAESGVGAKFDIGKVKAGAKVDFGAGVEYDYGSTWNFDGKEGKAHAEQMVSELNAYLAQQKLFNQYPTARWGFQLFGKVKSEPKPPDQSVSDISVDPSVSPTVGVQLPWDKEKPSEGGSEGAGGSEGSAGGEEDLPEGPQAGATLSGTADWTVVSDNNTGAQTYSSDYEFYAGLNGTIGPLEGEIEGLLGSSLSVTRDKSGNITNVTVTSTIGSSTSGTLSAGEKKKGGEGKASQSDSDVQVVTTSLDVTTKSQRAQVQQWLRDGAILTPDMIMPTTATKNDPIQNLFYQQAQVSQVDYNDVDNDQDFAAEVKLGVELGVELDVDDDKSTAVNASYYDAPDDSGVRHPVPFPECLGK